MKTIFLALLGLPPAMQKVMYKGLLPEDKTLREIKVTNGAKIMVVGSTINDVLAVNTPKEVIQQEVKAEENKKEPLCRQKVGDFFFCQIDVKLTSEVIMEKKTPFFFFFFNIPVNAFFTATQKSVGQR